MNPRARVSLSRWLGLLLLVFTALGAVACETPATQVLVQLDTDLPESRTVVVRVTAQQIDGDGGAFGHVTNWTFTRGGPLGEHQLPGTFGVTPPPGAARDARVQLVVSVFVAANSVVEPALFFRRTVRFRFTPNRTLGIGVFLSLACGEPATGCTGVAPGDCNVSTLCEERGLTCGDRAECIAGDVVPRDLDAGFRDDTGPLDATLDGEPSDAPAIVRCTTSDDECPVSDHCDTAAHLCVAGCHDDTGCPLRSAPHCDGTMHACVACTTDAHCPADTRCAGGSCVPGCADATQCSPGQSCCSGLCLDTLSNRAACGACGTTCTAANGVPACVAGACTIRECVAPFLDCNGDLTDGCEANRLTSADHCGACNRTCVAGPNATASCVSGACERACAAGFADCNGDPSDGCEVTLATDAAHCGACGRACNIANGTGACIAGACSIASCAPGFADCDANTGNGCETDTTVSVEHCGACGTPCVAPPASGATCGGGVCGFTCHPGFGDCDGLAANGCEADLGYSVVNCGMCGRSCSFANAAAGCAAGSCAITLCQTGFGDCDGVLTNGCETNLSNTVTSCGACGFTCQTTPNSTPACSGSLCRPICNTGYAECNGVASDGCETGPLNQFPVAACTNIASSATVTATSPVWSTFALDYMIDSDVCTRGLATAASPVFTFTFPAARSIRGITASPSSVADGPTPMTSTSWDFATSVDGTTFTSRRSGTAAQNQTWSVDLGANEMLRAIRISVMQTGADPGVGFRNVIVHSCP